MNISTTETSQRQHKAVLSGAALKKALVEIVAREAGVDPCASNVSVDVFISSNSGSIGPIEYTATVTITEDFGPAGG